MAYSGGKRKKYSFHLRLSLHQIMECMNYYRAVRVLAGMGVGLFEMLVNIDGRHS